MSRLALLRSETKRPASGEAEPEWKPARCIEEEEEEPPEDSAAAGFDALPTPQHRLQTDKLLRRRLLFFQLLFFSGFVSCIRAALLCGEQDPALIFSDFNVI